MTRRSKLASAAALAVATMLCAPAARGQQALAPRPLDPARIAADQVAALVQQTSDREATQDARDAAARRLLAIGRDEARNAISFALTDPANPGARLAAARAIADDLPPDPAFVDPLFVPLSDPTQPRALADAAAIALGNFKSMPDVSRRLVAMTDPSRAEGVRLVAIRALSSQVEKLAGEQLVKLTTDAAPNVAAAASEALQNFASLPLATPADWADWWRTQADHAEDRFRLEMLAARAVRFEQQARHGDETYLELRQSVLAQLGAVPRERLADEIAKLLASPRDAVRLIAVRQSYALATTGDLPAGARPAVRLLISDPVADVRLDAARTVATLNDEEASDALVRQIAVEGDARVRAVLAQTLGPIGNADAVGVLASLLDDSSPLVVQAAAQGLARLGEGLARQSPSAAADLADRVQGVLQSRGGALAPSVRESLIGTLVSFRQRSLRPLFVRLLTGSPKESVAVRKLAARGLGGLRDPQNVAVLVEALGDVDSAEVREQVVRALGDSADRFTLIEQPIYRRLDPAIEKDPAVRKAAWEVVRSMFDKTERAQLAAWPEREALRDDHAKRFELFTALAKKAEAEGDLDGQSSALQQAGDAQGALGAAAAQAGDAAVRQTSVARYAEATQNYQRALVISRAKGQTMVVEKLVAAVVEAMLRGRDYAGAAKFATDLFASPDGRGYQQSVGYQFKAEAQRLSQPTARQEDALRLIQLAVAIPSFPTQFRDQLNDIRRDVLARQQERNERLIFDTRIGLACAF